MCPSVSPILFTDGPKRAIIEALAVNCLGCGSVRESGFCMERWQINLNILWVSQVIALMSFGFGLPFLPFYIQELGVTDPVQLNFYTGILSAAPAVTMAIMAPLWGMAADRWGRKLMILRAMLAAVFVIGGMGLAQNVWQLVALRAAQGIFTGTITATNTFVAAGTPRDKLSYALGFLSSSNFIGYSIGPVVGGLLAEAMGYRFSFFAGALLMLGGFFLVHFMVVEEAAIQNSPTKEKTSRTSGGLMTPLIINLLLILFLMRVVRTVFSPYLPLYIQSTLPGGIGAASVTGYISGIAGLATAMAGLTLSRLGDRGDKAQLIRNMGLAGMATALCIGFAGNLWLFSALYGLLFFFLGGIEPLVMSMTAEKTPAEKRGALFGIQGTVGSLGWVLSPMLGAAIAIRWSNHAILLILPVLLVIQLGASWGLGRLTLKPRTDTVE